MTQYGFFPAPTADYTEGSEPELARRLNRLGRALKLHLIGISGYRTPAHSVAVGGFPNDPHTRGQASDTPGIEGVSERTLHRFGLTRPFGGARELDHIQLLHGGTASPDPRRPKMESLAQAWISNGGSKRLAPIMAAIAMAESGGRVDAVSPENDDGTVDLGAWQINSVHSQFDRSRLISDLDYNAKAAVAIERSQGLGAWTTYKTGAFRSFMSGASNAMPTFGRTRPGGEAPGESPGGGGGDGTTEFASYTTELAGIGLPGLPDPLGLFKGSADAVKDIGSFFKWIAWIFHPRNILRAVEFVTGLTLMGMGIQSMIAVWQGDPERASVVRAPRAIKSTTGEAISMAPVGRAARVGKAAKAGKQAARSSQRAKEVQTGMRKGRVKESKKITAKSNKRQGKQGMASRAKSTAAKVRKRPSEEDIPF